MIEYTRKMVVARLREKIPAELAHIASVPDRVDAFRLNHPKAALLVQYPGSTAVKKGTQLERKITIDVYVLTHQLAGAAGIDHYIDLVAASLFNYKPGSGFSGMLPTSDRFVDVDDERWQYVITFECIAPFYGQTIPLSNKAQS
jgi:hypothetical protein